MKKEVFAKLSALIIATLGFIAALAWNDAIQSLFNSIFDIRNNILAMFIYAIIITIVAVLIMIKIGKK